MAQVIHIYTNMDFFKKEFLC